MSKLNELINSLCPNGVEYKALKDITIWDRRFKNLNNAFTSEFHHISAEKIKTLHKSTGTIKLISTGNFDGMADENECKEFINDGEVVTLPSGGTANIKYYKGRFVDSGNLIAMSKDVKLYNTKFIYYYLRFKQEKIQNCYRGASVQHPDMKLILDLHIPIPPLEVQSEIVRILDNFALLTAELTAELTARKKQYEYYRDELLNVKENKAKYYSLDELFVIRNGYTPSKANDSFWTNGTIPWFRMDDIRINGNVLKDSIQHVTKEAVKGGRLFPANSIIMATTATIGEHALVIADSLANQQFTVFINCKSLKSKINMKYIYYYFYIIDEWCKKNTKVSSFPAVDIQRLKKYQIPLPSLEEQQRIVDILDKFDTLTNSITDGLPKEIEMRKKQYEHYRDTLLTFKELKTNA